MSGGVGLTLCNRTTGSYLGIAVATMVNLLNPDRVIIWGNYIRAESPLLEPIRRVVKQRTQLLPAEHAKVVAAELGAEAAAIGAVTLVMIW